MKKRLFFLIVLFVLSAMGFVESKAQDKTNEDVIKVDTSLVTIPVIVSDRNNHYVSGLKADNFAVYQDGEKQKIEYFLNEEAPINVAVLLDTSKSTTEVLGKIKKAAKNFIENLHPEDRALILSFDGNINLLSEFTSDQKVLQKAIKKAKIGDRPGTVLYDAVFQTVKRKMNGIKGRKAIILLTDGKDAGSDMSKDDLLNQLQESDTLVYSIYFDTQNFRPNFRRARFPGGMGRGGGGGGMGRGGMGRGGMGIPMPQRQPGGNGGNNRRGRPEMSNERAEEVLQQISDVTAGKFYNKQVDDLSEAFTEIAGELRQQYLIGYYLEKSEADKVYQIKVKVDQNDAVVRAKITYRTRSN